MRVNSIKRNRKDHVHQIIQTQHKANLLEQLRRSTNHPLAVSLIVQMTSTAQQEHQIRPSDQSNHLRQNCLHTNGLLIIVQTAEQTENLQKGGGRDRTILTSSSQRRNHAEGIVVGSHQNGGKRLRSHSLLLSLENTLNRADFRNAHGLLVGGELDAHGVNIGDLNVRKNDFIYRKSTRLGLELVVDSLHVLILLNEENGAREGSLQHVGLDFLALLKDLSIILAINDKSKSIQFGE